MLLSTAGGPAAAARCKAMGIEGYLFKPINPSSLFDKIMNACQGSLPEEVEAISELANEVGGMASSPPQRTQGLALLLVEDNMGDVRLMMTAPEKEEFDHPASILYFKVASIDAAYAALEVRGATFEDKPHLVGKMGSTEIWMFFVRDPERHLIGITEERAA